MIGIGKKRRGRFRLRLFAVFAAAAAGALSAAAHGDAATATALRAWQHPTHTRLTLELSEPVDFTVFALVNPDRLVIDFPALEFDLPDDPLGPDGVGVIAAVRHGRFKPGASRMVLDLSGPATVERAFLLPPGEDRPARFVIDLAESDRAAFTAFARASRPAAPAAPPPGAADEPVAADRPTVAIDPGHGGIDPGAPGRAGPSEKAVALRAALQLAERLEATGRYRVVMTRDRDVFVALRERVAIARAADADLFLSIHVDSIADSRLSGSHVYTLSEKASDAEAAALAAKENKSDIIAGLDGADFSGDEDTIHILIDLSQRQTDEDSGRIADLMVEAFARHGVRSIRRPHRQAGFAVLKAPDVPSLLIELGFLSNREDEERLRTREGRAPAIRAIVDAVERYFAAPAE